MAICGVSGGGDEEGGNDGSGGRSSEAGGARAAAGCGCAAAARLASTWSFSCEGLHKKSSHGSFCPYSELNLQVMYPWRQDVCKIA